MNSYYEKFTATGEVKCIDEEIPFEIPNTWCWVRLFDIAIYIQRGKSPKYSLVKKYPVVAQKCNQWSGFSIEKAQFIDPDTLSKYSQERILQNEDLMWNSTGLGTLGRMAVYYSKLNPYELAVADSHVTVIRLMKPQICPLFFYYYFISPTVQNVIEDKADGSTKQKELSTSTVCNYLVPLPPTEEQVRIISKIGEIFPVVYKYGEQQEKLDSLNIAINSLLKKSILQEAIQGKIVPQHAEEGTAEALLLKIKEEKQRLVKDGKLKKSALNDSVIFKGDDNKYWEKVGNKVICIDEEIPFEIPSSWSWTRVSSILNVCSARRVHQKDWREQGIPFYRAREIGKLAEKGSVDNELFIDHTLYEEFSKSGVPHEGDLMVTAVGTLGKVYVVKSGDTFYYKDGSVLCFANDYNMNPEYLKYVIESPMFISQFLGESQGTTVATLTMVRVNNYLIPLPPLQEQCRIVEQYKNVTSIMRR